MKKQTIKNVQRKLKKRQAFANNKYGEGAISNKECESLVRNNEKAITLIALVITILFRYDEIVKYSNNNSFLPITNLSF